MRPKIVISKSLTSTGATSNIVDGAGILVCCLARSLAGLLFLHSKDFVDSFAKDMNIVVNETLLVLGVLRLDNANKGKISKLCQLMNESCLMSLPVDLFQDQHQGFIMRERH